MNIQFTSKINASDGVKVVTYGRSGVGKTMLAATAPNPFIFSAEKGLLSLRKFNIAYVDISSFKQLDEAFMWALKSNETKKYQTFVLDSISEIAEVVLSDELERNKDPRKAYGNMQQSMYGLIRNFRDLKGKHVQFIAKQMIIEEGQLPVIKRASPIMPSQALQNQTPYFFDLVLHMYVGGIDPTTGINWRALHCTSSPEWDAKDRSGNLAAIEPPDLGYIFKKASE